MNPKKAGSWCLEFFDLMNSHNDESWHDCVYYVDSSYVATCEEAGIEPSDLFQKFSAHGEPTQELWMQHHLVVAHGVLVQIFGVLRASAPRFETFLRAVIPADQIPPTTPVVLPRVAHIKSGGFADDPVWDDVSRNGADRIRVITGHVVQPDDPLWPVLIEKWPGLGKR